MCLQCRFFWISTFLLSTAIAVCQDRIPGQILVQIREDSGTDQFFKNILPARSKVRLLSESWNVWLLDVAEGEEEAFLEKLRKDPAVIFAQFNHRLARRSIIPNDSLFSGQWNLENTGQSNGTPGADISATEAWELGAGGVTVLGDTLIIAVIDEGFYLQHEDLRFWKNRLDPHNGIDDDLNGYIDDYNGWDVGTNTDSIPNDSHGTHCAGIAAATGNNVIGVAGVAYNALLMPVSIPDYDEAEVVAAYSYIFDMRKLYNSTLGQKGAFVVATNSSFGINNGKPEDFPLWCAMYDSLGSVGILSVGATANITTDVEIAGDIPSLCVSDHLIIVTNTTRFDNKNNTAAFGAQSVDLGAPGTAIPSTIPFNNYNIQSGTSMSAAHVAGAVALMYSAVCTGFIQSYRDYPDSFSLIVKDYILKGTDLLNDLEGLTVSGGRLNLYNSMHSFFNDYCVSCLLVENTVSPVLCHGDSSGSIILSVSQGSPPYGYEWSSGDSSTSLAGLPRGKYSVKITDANGCEKYRYYEITQPSALAVNLISDSAVNGEDGAATAFVSGGVEPYAYQWNDSNNSTTSYVEDLSPGEYMVTVTDANGCVESKSTIVGGFTGINFPNQFVPAVKIHPNPVSSLVWVELVGRKKFSTQLSVSDVSGKLLLERNFSGEKFPLDFSDFQQGSYFIKITNEQYAAVKKVIRL